jgi:hypothetical protein
MGLEGLLLPDSPGLAQLQEAGRPVIKQPAAVRWVKLKRQLKMVKLATDNYGAVRLVYYKHKWIIIPQGIQKKQETEFENLFK